LSRQTPPFVVSLSNHRPFDCVQGERKIGPEILLQPVPNRPQFYIKKASSPYAASADSYHFNINWSDPCKPPGSNGAGCADKQKQHIVRRFAKSV
jgi:hypothetical protein